MKKVKWMAMVVAMVMIATMAGAAQRHDSAVLLVDVSGTVGEEGELNGAIELLRDMNSRFPDYVQSGGIMTFGNQTRPQLNWVLPTADYNESSLDGSLSGLGAGNGPTPIGAALRAVAPGVESAKGKKALIIVSDGQDTGVTNPVKQIEAMKKTHGTNLCVFTIQMGDDEDGAELLGELVSAGGCGTASQISSLQSDGDIQALVDFIFPNAPPPPPPPPKPKDEDKDGVLDKDDSCWGTPRGASVDYRGCWVKNIKFDSGSAEIKPQYVSDLDEVVSVLMNNTGAKIRVDGHTDSQGSEEGNQALSQKRAEAVMNYLISKGISSSQLTSKGYGEAKPIADNETEGGRAKNRRIELSVVK